MTVINTISKQDRIIADIGDTAVVRHFSIGIYL